MELSMSAYVVLGLIARHGPMTPYELKARVEESVGYFWPIPHAQLYRDPPRLAGFGLLSEESEETGRRRRVFHLTDQGRAELEAWLTSPDVPPAEFRDPAQLRLAFADLASDEDLHRLAQAQALRHRELLSTYRSRLEDLAPDDPATTSRARLLRLGIRHENAQIEFWESLAREES